MYIHFWSSDYDIAHNISHVQSEKYLVHSHPFYELHYSVRGDVELLYEGREIPVLPHSLTLISPNAPHGLKVLSDKHFERYTVHFTENVLSPSAKQVLLKIFSPDFQPGNDNYLKNMGTTNVLRYFQDLVNTEQLPPEVRNRIVPPMIEALLACVYLKISSTERVPATKPELYDRPDVIEYVKAHYKEHLSLEMLTDRFFCSKGYLNNLFKKETGTTVMAYIQQLRLAYAQVLLDNGYPAARASSLAGFNEYSSFYRAYTKLYGKAPSNDKVVVGARMPEKMLSLPLNEQAELMPESHPGQRSIWDLSPFVKDSRDDPSLLRDNNVK